MRQSLGFFWLISCLYICIGQARRFKREPLECQFTQKCIEESVLLATSEKKREYRPYCEDPDCKSLCGSIEKCCYPQVVNQSVPRDRTLQSCMPTYFGDLELLPEDKQYVMSYYTVDKNPPDGCVAEYGGSSGCSNNVAEWGSFPPVTSTNSELIYKNVECARCHGETKVDHWDSVKRCMENGELFSPDEMSHNNSDNCHTFFIPSGYDILLQALCFNKFIDSCNPNFELSAESHLSRSVIESLCTSGLVSPRRHIDPDITYANIFCLLCNVDLNLTDMVEEQKECASYDGEVKVLSSLTAFIDTRDGDDDDELESHVLDTKLACSVTAPNDCRPAYCSTGKVLANDTCQFLTDAFINGRYVLNVTLTYDKDSVLFFLSYIDEIKSNELLKSTLKGPWGENWDINTLSVKYSMHHLRRIKVVDKIYITMIYKPFLIVYIHDLIFEVEHILASTWSYVTTSLHRTFKMNTTLGHDIELTKEMQTSIRKQSIIPDTLFLDTNMIYGITPRNSISKKSTVYLSKLFFCEQIKLFPHEYTSFEDFAFVYVNQQGRLLANGEFIVVYSNTFEGIQICLDDAGYDIGISHSNEMSYLYAPHHPYLLTLCSALVACVYRYIK